MTNVAIGLGSRASTQLANVPDAWICHDPDIAVMHDAPTTIGSISLRTTCDCTPTPTRMNANSPICDRLRPAWIERLQPVAGQERRDRDARRLADDEHDGHDDRGQPVVGDLSRLDRHPDRQEEDRGEHVAERTDEGVDSCPLPDSAINMPPTKAPRATE